MDLEQYAIEGLFDPSVGGELRKSKEALTANELYKGAKRLYAVGSKTKAIEYMRRAQQLYQQCFNNLRKGNLSKTITRKVKQGNFEDTEHRRRVYANADVAKAAAYFEERSDTCKAYLMKWNRSNYQGSIEELKKQLRQERMAEKKRLKGKATESVGIFDDLMIDIEPANEELSYLSEKDIKEKNKTFVSIEYVDDDTLEVRCEAGIRSRLAGYSKTLFKSILKKFGNVSYWKANEYGQKYNMFRVILSRQYRRSSQWTQEDMVQLIAKQIKANNNKLMKALGIIIGVFVVAGGLYFVEQANAGGEVPYTNDELNTFANNAAQYASDQARRDSEVAMQQHLSDVAMHNQIHMQMMNMM